MAVIFNLPENLKNRVIVGEAGGIVKRPVGQTFELAAPGKDRSFRLSGQSVAHGLLVRGRQAFHQFNDVQRKGAHPGTFAEIGRGVKWFGKCPGNPLGRRQLK
jgi:hypothetical protein